MPVRSLDGNASTIGHEHYDVLLTLVIVEDSTDVRFGGNCRCACRYHKQSASTSRLLQCCIRCAEARDPIRPIADL